MGIQIYTHCHDECQQHNHYEELVSMRSWLKWLLQGQEDICLDKKVQGKVDGRRIIMNELPTEEQGVEELAWLGMLEKTEVQQLGSIKLAD